MFRVWGLILATLTIFALIFPDHAGAQTRGNVVGEIIIEGTQRIEPDTVRSYLLLQSGDTFDPRRIDQSLKSLYATGLFTDVAIFRVLQNLIVRVVENPVINRIAFEGNLRIEDEMLQKEVTLRPRVVFTRTKVQQDVKRILDVYRVNGRFAATVAPKVIRLDQNRADLVFEIDEGPLTKVEKINFIGNRVESDSDLRDVVRTKETAFYRFFSSDDTYDPDRVTFDRELLRQHYLNSGYADFRVISAVAELTHDRSAFFLTFTVEEGERYKFGTSDIAVGIRGINGDNLAKLIEYETDDWYDNRKIDKSVEDLTDEVGTLGFAFVEVRPRVNRDRGSQTINITFDISEGPRVFVERIEIVGNVRTSDKVIRREIQVAEGDAFNAAKIRRSRKRIRDLDYFSKVDIENIPGSAEDKATIKVEVEEKSTGSLNIGVGFATDSGPLIDLGVTERNLLGRGQRISLNTSLAAEKTTFNLGFTEPYFLDREVAAGFDVFHTDTDLQDTRSLDTRRTGAGLRLGYPLSEDLRQSLQYTFEYAEVKNVSFNASELIKAQERERYVSKFGHMLEYDLRDSRLAPTEGFVARMRNELAGLGGTVRFLKNTLQAAQYYSPAKDWVLSVTGRAGFIYGLSEDVQISDRFFLGGENLRGFATAGAGPRDTATDDALGGEWIYNASLQMQLPLGLPKEFGLIGRVFTDMGSTSDISPSNSNVADSGNIRASAGVGFGWISPFGPVNVDFGVPLLKDSVDIKENIRLNFGTRF